MTWRRSSGISRDHAPDFAKLVGKRHLARGIGVGRSSLEVVGQWLGSPASAAAMRIGDGVVGDAEQPRPEGRALVMEVRQRAQGGQEDALGHVLRVVVVAELVEGVAVDAVQVPAVERREGGASRPGRPARPAGRDLRWAPAAVFAAPTVDRSSSHRLPRRAPHAAAERRAPPRPRQRPAPRVRHPCRGAGGPGRRCRPPCRPADRCQGRPSTCRPSSAETRGQPCDRATPHAPATPARHPAR